MGGKSITVLKWGAAALWGALAGGYYLAVIVCVIEVGLAVGGPDNTPILVGALLVFAAWLFIILVHELGHAVAAWVQGWRVLLIVVRGLTIWPGKRRAQYGVRPLPGNHGMV